MLQKEFKTLAEMKAQLAFIPEQEVKNGIIIIYMAEGK